MNALAILYVNAHLQDLLDEAAEHRRYRVDRPSLFERIAPLRRSAGLAGHADRQPAARSSQTLDDSPNRS